MKSTSIWYLGGDASSYAGRVAYAGITKSILERCNAQVSFTYIDGQNTYLSPNIINQINNCADILLVGNGGFVRREPGFIYNINRSNARSIRVPIIACSVEDNDILDESNYKDELTEFIKVSQLFSVATSGTIERIGEMGIDTGNVFVAPDSGIFIQPSKVFDKTLDNKYCKVGICWENDDSNVFDKIVSILIDRFNAKIYLLEHDDGAHLDGKSNDVWRRLLNNFDNDRVSVLKNDMRNELFPPSDSSVALLADIYRQMDCVIGANVQSAMLSVGQNTPFVGVGNDKYLQNFMIDAGLGSSINIVSGAAHEVIREFESIRNNSAAIKSTLAAAKSQFQYSNEWFIDKILSLDVFKRR